MKRSSFILAAAIALTLTLGAPARADFPALEQWVLATAKATGAGGEEFVSSLRIVNPSSQTATVTILYFAQSPVDATYRFGGSNANPPKVTLTIGAAQTAAVEDVIGTHFAAAAAPFGISAGGLKITSDFPVSVLSRTYVANARSATGVAGTYGFSIPGVAADFAISAGDTALLPYISSSSVTTTGFRTNVPLLNTVAVDSVVNVALVQGDGTQVGNQDYTLGAFSAGQIGNVAQALGFVGDDTNLKLVATVKSGGPILIGASIIDNAISSINYAPPTKICFPNNGAFGMVYTSADIYGLGGTIWIQDGTPTYMTILAVPTGCSLVFLQAWGSGTAPNTTFTRNDDGSFAFTGSSPGGSWSGTISPWVDGSLRGTLTVTSSGTMCNGKSIVYSFKAAKSALLLPAAGSFPQ